LFKRSVQKISVTFLLLISSIIALNYIVDPYGYNSRDGKFIKNLTMFNKPHVTNARINSDGYYYLIGSSRMARVNPQAIEKISGKQTHNIKIDGATLPENYNLAFRVKDVGKFFIYSFDTFSANKARESYKEIMIRNEQYQKVISDNVFFTKFFNSDITLRTLQHLIKILKGEVIDKQYLEENSRFSRFDFDTVLDKSGILNNLSKSNFSNFDVYPDESIIRLATLATKDDIFIIFPKYYSYYPLFAKYQDIEAKYFSSIRALVNNTDAKVWSFYGRNSITEDENNFIDNGWHFKPHVSNIIFQEVLGDNLKDLNNQNGFLLNKENLENYLSSIAKDKS
jgi:hypothetical protein